MGNSKQNDSFKDWPSLKLNPTLNFIKAPLCMALDHQSYPSEQTSVIHSNSREHFLMYLGKMMTAVET